MPNKILLIDDIPSFCDGIKSILSYSTIEYNIACTYSLETAYNLIYNKSKHPDFDLICFDVSMPIYAERNLKNGADLAKLVKKDFPKIKTIIFSGDFDLELYQDLNQNLKPEGLFVKSDMNGDQIIDAFNQVITGNYFRSAKTTVFYETRENNKQLSEQTNLQIIKLLAQGYGDETIANNVFLSLSGLKKRKSLIKQLLDLENGNNEAIIAEAKKRKLINGYH